MTPFQSRQIRDLRLRGVGYKGIASVTGLTRDIVRNYCKSHGLNGLGIEVTTNIREQMESGAACQCCGKPLIQPRTGGPGNSAQTNAGGTGGLPIPTVAIPESPPCTQRPALIADRSLEPMATASGSTAVMHVTSATDFGALRMGGTPTALRQRRRRVHHE